ncbi:MAG: hypothetical protein H6Q52_1801 [Deltaproteobacteria bacterium]|nr:hypothetical protein [Deltaproteobacteria bacterium]
MRDKSCKKENFTRSYGACIAVILFFIIALPPLAFCQTDGWQEFFTNSVGDIFLYDRENVNYAGQFVTVAVKAISRAEGTGIQGITQVIEFDCEKSLQRRLRMSIVKGDGSIDEDTRPQNWSPYSSLTEALPQKLCKKQIFRRKQAR